MGLVCWRGVEGGDRGIEGGGGAEGGKLGQPNGANQNFTVIRVSRRWGYSPYTRYVIDDDDDDFDYEELLHHVEPQVLNSMGTDRGLDNMEILEKSSREPLYDESNGCGKEFTQLCVVLELLKLKASHG
jgi:hypothetical protein